MEIKFRNEQFWTVADTASTQEVETLEVADIGSLKRRFGGVGYDNSPLPWILARGETLQERLAERGFKTTKGKN